ncbi:MULTISPECIES: YdeI/OmpD-associated family protein [unclassified Mesorhizobium]|uniref:YdeI/OmpD-associated family protein n=1 Tax=unclassified Mesorhizobium TaxID=325217 RepID=UPI00333E0332
MLKRPLAKMPDSLRAELEAANLMTAFEQRPPYQRNDYLHWIERARHPETRRKRINQMIDELTKGGIYMGMKKRAEIAAKLADPSTIIFQSVLSASIFIDFPTSLRRLCREPIVTIEPILHFRSRQVAI